MHRQKQANPSHDSAIPKILSHIHVPNATHANLQPSKQEDLSAGHADTADTVVDHNQPPTQLQPKTHTYIMHTKQTKTKRRRGSRYTFYRDGKKTGKPVNDNSLLSRDPKPDMPLAGDRPAPPPLLCCRRSRRRKGLETDSLIEGERASARERVYGRERIMKMREIKISNMIINRKSGESL
ncbi:hypothetical protein Dimus_039171 [Dionaea muscipula]